MTHGFSLVLDTIYCLVCICHCKCISFGYIYIYIYIFLLQFCSYFYNVAGLHLIFVCSLQWIVYWC